MKNMTAKKLISIKEALKKINASGHKCLIIVDDKDIVIGTLSDGDIRKAILAGNDISDTIEKVYNDSPICVVNSSYNLESLQDIFLKNKIDIIPIINQQGVLVDCVGWETVFSAKKEKRKLSVPTVIVAGGEGTRLKPFTNVLPKPLIPVHDKPIINHIIDKFLEYGIGDFWVTLNHKSRILRAYFQEISPDYEVGFVQESKPLGTAGSLKLLAGSIRNPFFVSNCDILIQSDYADLYDFHVLNKADITLVASMKEYVLPYGTCVLGEDGFLESIKEKPKLDFLVNTGLYVINPSVLNIIPHDQYYDMDQLLRDMKKRGMQIAVYPINDENWIDIGQWDEYKKALDFIETI